MLDIEPAPFTARVVNEEHNPHLANKEIIRKRCDPAVLQVVLFQAREGSHVFIAL